MRRKCSFLVIDYRWCDREKLCSGAESLLRHESPSEEKRKPVWIPRGSPAAPPVADPLSLSTCRLRLGSSIPRLHQMPSSLRLHRPPSSLGLCMGHTLTSHLLRSISPPLAGSSDARRFGSALVSNAICVVCAHVAPLPRSYSARSELASNQVFRHESQTL